MFGARFVINFAAVMRILRRLQKILDQIHRIVQKVVVSLANVDVQLAFELWPKLRPIAFRM